MSTTYTLALSDHELGRYRQMGERAVRHEADAWRAAGIVSCARIADIGCGPGIILAELARRAGTYGSAVGVDQSHEALAAASAYLEASGITNARAVAGTADATGLEPGAYDVVNVRHVLLHNGPRIAEILAHLSTLLRPGGCLYLVEVDLTGARSEQPPEDDATELSELWRELLTQQGNDIAVGPSLGRHAREAGLEVVRREARYDVVEFPPPPGAPPARPPAWAARDAIVAAGLATEDDVERWDRALTARAESREPNAMFVPIFTVVARRP